MKEIVNRTPRPIQVPLPGGKRLHLGPGKTGQVSDKAAEHPALLRLIEDETIAFTGDSEQHAAGRAPSGVGHESTHGHPQPTVVTPRGNR